MKEIFIGIDPDVEASGYAVWNKTDKILETLTNKDLSDVFEGINLWSMAADITVVVDAGWLNQKTSFHGHGKSVGVREKIAERVGANHEVGRQIVRYCEKFDIPVRALKPLGKVDSKFFAKATGWKGRTNQDQRDAGMRVFGF